MAKSVEYVGGELELFADAVNWKDYFYQLLAPFIRGDVLEVGAGLGATTVHLRKATRGNWTCLEPDAELVGRLRQRFASELGDTPVRVAQGTVADLDSSVDFDSIVYIDVLEHILDDALELRRAASRLRRGGRIIVLSPAHGWLFTPFDTAIGHHRRYTRRTLARVSPPGLTLERSFYVDSVGLLASLGNRILLRRSMPTVGQIRLWDRWMVPLSRQLDPIVRFRLGKSVIASWLRPST